MRDVQVRKNKMEMMAAFKNRLKCVRREKGGGNSNKDQKI